MHRYDPTHGAWSGELNASDSITRYLFRREVDVHDPEAVACSHLDLHVAADGVVHEIKLNSLYA